MEKEEEKSAIELKEEAVEKSKEKALERKGVINTVISYILFGVWLDIITKVLPLLLKYIWIASKGILGVAWEIFVGLWKTLLYTTGITNSTK